MGEKKYLGIDDSFEVKDIKVPEESTFENVGMDNEEAKETLDKITDMAENSELYLQMYKEVEQKTIEGKTNESPPIKPPKEYIDIREHKHIEEDLGNWLDEPSESKKESDEIEEDGFIIKKEPSNNSKIQIDKLLEKLPFKITPYYAIVGLLGIVLFIFLAFGKNSNIVSPGNSNNSENTITDNSEDPKASLTELSTIVEKYTTGLNSVLDWRTSELRVSTGYVDGTYSLQQLKNIFSQTAAKKDALLSDIENKLVTSNLSELKALMERYVRYELNSSKQVIADIQKGIKGNDIYTAFNGSGKTALTHAANMCDELEKILKQYNVEYTRDNYKFTL